MPEICYHQLASDGAVLRWPSFSFRALRDGDWSFRAHFYWAWRSGWFVSSNIVSIWEQKPNTVKHTNPPCR